MERISIANVDLHAVNDIENKDLVEVLNEEDEVIIEEVIQEEGGTDEGNEEAVKDLQACLETLGR